MKQVETNNNNLKQIDILKRAFREYYYRYSKTIEVPNRLKEREFGYTRFGGTGMIRHLQFKNMGEFIATLIREAPSDVYYSNSYYKFPSYPIQEKQWLGGDLIFDIDGKDLNLDCVPSHSYLICSNCGQASPLELNKTKQLCSICNGKDIDQVSVPCDKCIKASKKQVKHLIEVLTADFGIEERHIHVYFSGNNGFHITVKDISFIPFDSRFRLELVSYVLGDGLMIESMGVRKDGLLTNQTRDEGFRIKFPKGGFTYGWRHRLARELKLKIDNSSEDRLSQLVKTNGGYEGFKVHVNKIIQDMGVLIDKQVTADTHRIFRMPGTLSSKSGLAKIRCNNIDTIDPFKDACVLGDEKVGVRVKTSIKLRLKGKSAEIKNESLELPTYAAVYLICKGLAEVM